MKIRSSAFAGQVEEKNTETIFGLRGGVFKLEASTREAPSFHKPTRSVTTFKPEGNRLHHKVEGKCSGVWHTQSRYVYRYSEEGVRSGPRFFGVEGGRVGLNHKLIFEYEGNKMRRGLQKQCSASGALHATIGIYGE